MTPSKSIESLPEAEKANPEQVLHLHSAVRYLRAENSRLKSQLMGISLSSLDFESEVSKNQTKELTEHLNQANTLVKEIQTMASQVKVIDITHPHRKTFKEELTKTKAIWSSLQKQADNLEEKARLSKISVLTAQKENEIHFATVRIPSTNKLETIPQKVILGPKQLYQLHTAFVQ